MTAVSASPSFDSALRCAAWAAGSSGVSVCQDLAGMMLQNGGSSQFSLLSQMLQRSWILEGSSKFPWQTHHSPIPFPHSDAIFPFLRWISEWSWSTQAPLRQNLPGKRRWWPFLRTHDIIDICHPHWKITLTSLNLSQFQFVSPILIILIKGQLGVHLTVCPWYLLCSPGILGGSNP